MKPALIATIMLVAFVNFAVWGQGKQYAAQPQNKTENVAPTSDCQPHSDAKAATADRETPHWYESPEWVLVIVGIVTAFVIGWQSYETRRAAESSAESGQAFISAERAWVLVETGTIPDDFQPDPNRVQVFQIWPVVINRGRTAGRVTGGLIKRIEIPTDATLPPEPDYTGDMGEINFVLAPNVHVQPMHISMDAGDFIRLRQGQGKLYIYGFITYSDIGEQTRETRFCFVYFVPSGFTAQPRGFYHAADVPPPYTRCT